MPIQTSELNYFSVIFQAQTFKRLALAEEGGSILKESRYPRFLDSLTRSLTDRQTEERTSCRLTKQPSDQPTNQLTEREKDGQSGSV